MAAPAASHAPQMMMAALAYAKRYGWPVVPLHHVIVGADGTARCSCAKFKTCGGSAGKHPRVEAWQAVATTDDTIIGEWWRQWPNAGIGIATGAASGFWVLDIDPAHGGDESLAELQATHGTLPTTVEAITGSGGRHLLFRHPGGQVPNRVAVRPGIDVRGDGGQIAAAPTLHASGRRYVWESSSRPGEVELADAPPWLMALIQTPPKQKVAAGLGDDVELPELNARMALARSHLAGIPGAVSGKGGHQQTFFASLDLTRGFALPLHAALELLAAEYNPRCTPPWSLAELEHKVTSASTSDRRPLGYLLQESPPTPESERAANEPDAYEDEERAAIADEAKAPESPFHWITTADVFAPLPATKWLVPGLQLCPGRPAMTAAYGASGKTLALQSLALAFAAGRRAWGEFSTGRGGIVCHVDHEQGKHATLKRYQRLAVGYGIERDDIADRLRVSLFPPVYLNTARAEGVYAHAFEGVDLVIIDALRGATPGSDENDSKIRESLDVLSRVSEKTGVCFWIIHHAGKPKDGHEDLRTLARGSSAIFDACGSAFVMVGEKGEPKLVSQVKQPAEAEGCAIEDFYLAIEDVAVEQHPNAGVRVAYQTKEQVRPPTRPEDGFKELVAAVLDVIRRNPDVAGKARIAAILQRRENHVAEAVVDLLERGAIVNVGTDGRPRLRATGEAST